MTMFRKAVLGVTFAVAALCLNSGVAQAATQAIDFDDPSDLTNYFTADSSPEFTNGTSGGINNTGSVNVPLNSYDVWTSKNGFDPGAISDTYEYNGYFHVAANGGYGILGFSPNATNNPTTTTAPTYMQVYGQPSQGVGISFHGGGAYLIVDDAIADTYTWFAGSGDLVIGNWYYATFTVTRTGASTYDAVLSIYNTDSTGTLGSLFTQQTTTGFTSTSLGSATLIYPVIGAAGSRMDRIDGISLDTSTQITFAAPEVALGAVSGVMATQATVSATVTSDNGEAVTERAICFGGTPTPSVDGECTAAATAGVGAFTVQLADLLPGATYYYQACATNAVGTTCSAVQSFTTLAAATTSTSTDPEDTLADTGASVGQLVLAVSLAIASGGLLLVARRGFASDRS